MVTDLFGMLLQEVGTILNIKDLKADQNNSCLIKLKSGLKIQIEMDRTGQFLLIGSDLGDLPAGPYRLNIFREALKANGSSPPLHGILAFSAKTQHLVLFSKLMASQLNGDKMTAELNPFIEKATLWSEALKRGDVPIVSQPAASGGMFGMR